MSILTDPTTGEQFQFSTRAEWGARAPRSRTALANTANGTFMHHSVTAMAPSDAIWRAIQNYHMDRNGWQDIAYSFGVDMVSGQVYEGRGLGIAGGHTAGYNSTSHAICFIGNTDNQAPTQAAKRAYLAVQRVIEGRYGQGSRRGHRDVNATGCPGGHGYAWLRHGFPVDADGDVTEPGPDFPVVPPPAPPAPSQPRILRVGHRGDDVKQWQARLAGRGYWIAADGIFGPLTEGITRWFQQARRIGVDGAVGPQTRTAMDAAEREGWDAVRDSGVPAPVAPSGAPPFPGRLLRVTSPMLSGGDVRTWQQRMRDRGWRIGVDGFYGAESRAVAEAFQREKGISVDGIVGPQTWSASWDAPVT